MLVPATTRLNLIVHAYSLRVDDRRQLLVLYQVDRKLRDLVLTTSLFSVTDLRVRVGFAELLLAIDRQLIELGHVQFAESEKALQWLVRPELSESQIRQALTGPYAKLRDKLWSFVPNS